MLYLFDKDGTLVVTKSGKPCANDIGDQELLPNVAGTLARLSQQGHKISIVTNQGGVSHGFMTPATAYCLCDEIIWLVEEVGSVCGISAHHISFYHETGKDRDKYACFPFPRPKPSPDMIIEAINKNKFTKSTTTFIGNQYTDELAARAAGVHFIWAHEFFRWSNDFVEWTEKGYFPKDWLAKWTERKYGAIRV